MLHADKLKRTGKYFACAFRQRTAESFRIRIGRAVYRASLIEAVEIIAYIKDVTRYDGRLVVGNSRQHLLGEERKRLYQLAFLTAERRNGRKPCFALFCEDTACSRIGILSIGTRVSVKGKQRGR